MKNLFVQFKSGKTLEIEDIYDYVESQDFYIVVRKGDKKESHITIFHDVVEYMIVTDDESKEDDLYEKRITKFDDETVMKGDDSRPHCDRNICLQNEYNGMGCKECIINKETSDGKRD